MNSDLIAFFGFLLAFGGGVASAIVYINSQNEKVKAAIVKEIIKESSNLKEDLNREIKWIKDEIKTLQVNQENLIRNVGIEGDRINQRFVIHRHRWLELKVQLEGISRKVYDFACDIEELYEQSKITRRKRNMTNYNSFVESMTPKLDYDTLKDAEQDINSGLL